MAGRLRPLRRTTLRRRREVAPENAYSRSRADDDGFQCLARRRAARHLRRARRRHRSRTGAAIRRRRLRRGQQLQRLSHAERNVPLVIPEVNADHLALIEQQCWRKQSGGYIVTNPNCSAIGLVLALAPLHRKFGIESVFVTTMQAVSGAGYPGVASLDILGNVIPYIAKEEEKMEEETRKLLGRLDGDHVEQADFTMTAHCNRVAVEDGHTESVSVKLKRKAAPEEMIAAFNEFPFPPQE